MIHQELNLMPFMTVAENIWIRREPKNRFGLVDHADDAPQDGGAVQRGSTSTSTREIEVRDLTVANRQMVEIAKAVSYESDVLIMDEPTSALTETRGDASLRDHPRPARRRAKASSTSPTR